MSGISDKQINESCILVAGQAKSGRVLTSLAITITQATLTGGCIFIFAIDTLLVTSFEYIIIVNEGGNWICIAAVTGIWLTSPTGTAW